VEVRNEILDRGKLNEKGCFVTVRELDTVEAIRPYLMRKFFLVDGIEPELPEETLLIGEHEDPAGAQLPRFIKAMQDKIPADPLPDPVPANCQGTHLGEAVPTHVQSADADNTVFKLIDGKVTNGLVELVQGTREHLSRFSMLVDQRLDGSDISDTGLSQHGPEYPFGRSKSREKQTGGGVVRLSVAAARCYLPKTL
jgi:hypothetical protein